MNRKLRTEEAVSAGGVVWRYAPEGGIEIVICGRNLENHQLWGLPKGTPDPGESLEQTALREVAEETGLQPELGELITTIEYWFVRGDVRYHKFVHHYLMRAAGGDTGDHDHEYDIVRWAPAEEALRALSHANEATVLRRALDLIPPEGR